MENKIFIENLRAYNEGGSMGKWVDLPIDPDRLDDIISEISIDGRDEIFIPTYELDENLEEWKIDEYENISGLNEIFEELEAYNDYEILCVRACLEYGETIQTAMEYKDDVIIYSGCNSMADVAEQYCDETGILNEVPESIRYYIDFEAMGRDMDIEGKFIELDNGYAELLF